MSRGFDTSDLCVMTSSSAGHYQSTWEQPLTLTQAGIDTHQCVLDTTTHLWTWCRLQRQQLKSCDSRLAWLARLDPPCMPRRGMGVPRNLMMMIMNCYTFSSRSLTQVCQLESVRVLFNLVTLLVTLLDWSCPVP